MFERFFTTALTTALATGLILSATMAQAVDVTGATISTTYSHENGNGSAYALQGSGAAMLSDQFGLQLDLGVWKYDSSPTLGGAALHGVWQASPDWVLGAFVNTEDWDGTTYYLYGIEAAWTQGPIRVEAMLGLNNESGSPWDATVAALTGRYSWDNGLSALGGIYLWDEVGYSETTLLIGGRYDFGTGPFIEAGFLYEDNSFGTDQVVQVRFGYEFGAGTPFTARLWPDVSPSN